MMLFRMPTPGATILAGVLLAAGCAGIAPGSAPMDPPGGPEAEIAAPPAVAAPILAPEISWTGTPIPRDLWDRIRAGYALPGLSHARVDAELQWYARHQDYLDRVAERAAPYLHHIVEEIERRGLPMELALLPVVESAYDPWAYSHGRAAGLWQFIPGTGRLYALDQDWWHDERRDVLESTRAALEHLEDLAERYDGNWHLALAAYNSGAGNVNKALRRARANGDDGSDFFALHLPRETRAYVPRLVALARLVADPEAHGVELPPIDDTPAFEVVATGGQIDLARAAELAGIDDATLYALNPGLNRWATHPEGPHRLLVPVGHGTALAEGLATLPQEERVAWTRHTIRPGEALSLIAQRYGVDVPTIQRVNRLRGSRIRAGDALLIPVASAPADAYSGALAQRDARRAERIAARQGDAERLEHRVRDGESFWSIARRHGVPMRQLARWNGMGLGDPLQPGQTLVLFRAPTPDVDAPPGGGRDSVIRELAYRVRSGDSLWAIADRFGLRIADIVDWNSLDAERLLQPGQRLKLFVDVTAL
jgi:membrane-bound lytic murein transglycosylase D